MSPGRGDDIPRPKAWKFTFGDRQAANGWAELVRSAPNAADHAWVAITSDAKRTDGRQHQLKGNLATATHRGKKLPQWQYEVSGGGRVWYLVDDEQRHLILTHAGPGHPQATDKGVQRRKR